ncbi:MAG: acyl-CoA dehydratase activase [Spirochaetota bacterium]
MQLHLGLDIGSVSINTVLMDENKKIVKNYYHYCYGRPFYRLREILRLVLDEYSSDSLGWVAITGTGGKVATELIGGCFINEIVAQASSVAHLYPQARTVVEMGGEDSKLIFMNSNNGKSELVDFAMNSICAAGTGSFLDQQARRLGVSIENEFGRLALRSDQPPRIAGRCSVFAKSDMIHLQQIATPVHDIVAGLCFAVARNFKSHLAQGKRLPKPLIFQGGVAANAGMVKAFREVLGLDEDQLIIPRYHASMGAIGAVYNILDYPPATHKPFKGLSDLENYLRSITSDYEPLEPLNTASEGESSSAATVLKVPDNHTMDVYLGLDVGSLSTNVVLIDDHNRVVSRRYLPTAGRPLEAIRKGISDIYGEVGKGVRVKAAGSTGSGRYLTGDFIGADTIQNEITAQATAAVDIDPEVDTIFEIGGQDSKYISIDRGVVVDFEMNKVCAAGTGSFLEEQAEKLDINIVEQFGDIALNAPAPARLGDRCTVFMESDLNSHQQKGVHKENLIAGLAYSIVHNYIQKVVGDKRIGDAIFFQGGVASNKAVVAAFRKVTGKKVTVPPHHDVTGAIGAAMLARQSLGKKKTRFKGFDIASRSYSVDRFSCRGCANQCEIRRVKIEGETRPLYYGGRCEKYEIDDRKGRGKGIPNLFHERMKMLMGDHQNKPPDGRVAIGIPRALTLFYQQFPFWRSFFENLGFRVVVSDQSDQNLVRKSLEMIVAETCFPIELMHGHVRDLLDKRVDYIFIPSIINDRASEENPTINYNCPWVQSYPYMVKAALSEEEDTDRLLMPVFHFRYFGRVLNNEIAGFMNQKFGISRSRVMQAVKQAEEALREFEQMVSRRGEQIFQNLPAAREAVVVIGRPYNTSDPELNLRLVEKLINHEVLPIPMDFLPLEQENIFNTYPMMYWPNGRKVLAATRIVARHSNLNAVYLGNFRCGPDSFLSHFVREEMKGKPYLQLEVDEHSADAGMITRCEAFLDSLKGSRRKHSEEHQQDKAFTVNGMRANISAERQLFVPYMCDHAYALAAASRYCGVNAQVLPLQDEKDLELGRKYTSSRECFPMICTTGSFLKKIMEPGFDPKKSSFFMPDHNGPCRFGQYNRLQRIVFDRMGYSDVEIVSPGNDNSYQDLSAGHGNKFRLAAWKGIVAIDLLRKFLQETRPYEKNPGESNRVYQECLGWIINSVEAGAGDLHLVMARVADAFWSIEINEGPRKPVISVTGEIFMRDNPFWSGWVVSRLEKLGAETMIAPVREWIAYTTYRYWRDSTWTRSVKGLLRAKIQEFFQDLTEKKLKKSVDGRIDLHRDIPLEEVLELCSPYIDKSYDGEPALVMGSSVGQVPTGICGVANILPFTCMPGTLLSSISGPFRKDHQNIPWVDVVYDGQEDTSIDTRLQAFMYQAREYQKRNNLIEPVKR